MDKPATPDRDPVAQPAVNSAKNIPPTPPSPSAPAAPPAPGPEETPPEVPLTPMGWLAQNAIYLVLLAALVIWIVSSFGWEGLPSAALTILGIGFIIFIHELGHFLVAKWCDVHVLTFSIGFGPALPGCSFKRGETTYKLSLLPLGGYVNMVGEGNDADESEDYPRSFKNKSVGQRMAIISAGVIMNVIFGIVCFIFVFRSHGVERTAATVGGVEPGSPAWIEGVRTGWKIVRIGDNDKPSFEDLRQVVALSGKQEVIRFEFIDPSQGDKEIERGLEPKRAAGGMTPIIGVSSLNRLELLPPRDRKVRKVPYFPGSPADAARVLNLRPGDRVVKATDPDNADKLSPLGDAPEPGKRWYDDLARRLLRLSGKEIQVVVQHDGKQDPQPRKLPQTGFDFGDTIVAMTDPSKAGDGGAYDPFRVSDLPLDLRVDRGQRDPYVFRQRLKRLAGKPVIIQVRRDGTEEEPPVSLFVPPAFHNVLRGVRMEMGKVAAVRKGSAAEKAGLKPRNSEDNEGGDIIRGVLMTGEGGKVLFAAGESALGEPLHRALPLLDQMVRPLDPVRLPAQLAAAARRHRGKISVTLLVPRPDESHETTDHALPAMDWDPSWNDDNEVALYASSPVAIPQLGVAYWAKSRIDAVEKGTDSPAEKAGLKPGDVIYRIRWSDSMPGEPPRWSRWHDLKTKRDNEEVYESWGPIFRRLQEVADRKVQFGIRRDGEEIKEPFEVNLDTDPRWPLEGQDRGLILMPDIHLERAANMGEALRYGVQETWRFITNIYLGLSRVITGRVSTETFGGPIEIVSTTFLLAGDDFYKFLIFLAVLSINLAVVNFLPIPLLDGGHMVFLIYEKLRGKPASEQVRAIATYIGLAMLLTLMVYVFYLDIKRRVLG